MKQKIIAVVFLAVTMYIPASSKECGKVARVVTTQELVDGPALKPAAVAAEQIIKLPASPLCRLLFNL